VSLARLLELHATITVAGLAKNAGKTTVLNHLLAELDGPFGLASLGLDGESRDQLTGLAKPRVRPPAGALVATAEGLAGNAPVRQRLAMRTAVGEVVLVESTGEAVIVSGPARLDELDRTLDALRDHGVRRILLEGALGRLGTAAPGRADAVVLAAGASLANGPDDYPLRVRLALDALDLPVSSDAADVTVRHAAGFEEETAALVPTGGSAVLEGALTGPLLEGLLRAGTRCTLIVADATRVLARPQQIARARRAGVGVVARRPLAIAAVTSSPFHPDRPMGAGEAFDALCDAAAARWPVVDVVSGRTSE
jgi:hypothetical protein